MVTKQTSKKRIDEVVIARAIAILAVLSVHSTSVAVVTLLPDSNAFTFYNALNTFSRFGTTTFIMLSSLVLFYSYYHRPLSKELMKRFYTKRLFYILVPYLIFSLMYTYVNSNYFADFATFPQFWSEFIDKLLIGKAHTHLYFVYISVQFYLLFPILLYFFKRFAAWTKHLIWLGFFIQWAYVLLNHYIWKYPTTGSISLSYMSYFFTGAFIGIYYEQIKTWIESRKSFVVFIFVLWALTVTFHIYLWHSARAWGAVYDTKLFSLAWNLHTYFTALVVLIVSAWLIRRAPSLLLRVLIPIGNLSFGIYLIHPLYLKYYRMHVDPGGDMMMYHLFIIGSFIGSLLVSIVIVYLVLYKFKWGWIFFGAKPRPIHIERKTRGERREEA